MNVQDRELTQKEKELVWDVIFLFFKGVTYLLVMVAAVKYIVS